MSSAKRTLADLKVFGKGYVRNGAALFFGIIFPVILIALFGAIFAGSGSGQVTVYVQNKDAGIQFPVQMNVGNEFVQAINGTLPNGTRVSGTWPLDVPTLVDPTANFTKYLADHSASDGIIIPADFSANFLSGKQENVTVFGNPTSSTNGIIIGTVEGVATSFNLNYFQQKYNDTTPAIISISTATVNTQQTKYIDFLIPGLIGFAILVSPMFAMVNITSEYKKIKLFKQLSLTPLHKMEWLASKVIWYIILSIISLILLVAVGIFAFGAHITLTPWLIPFLILGPMMFSSLGMLVGTIAKSVESASVLGNIITFPMMFLSGTFFPLSTMPQYLQNFAHVLPLFYIVEGLNNVMVYGNISAGLIDIGVTAIITAVFFVAAAKLFKWRED
ncbi:MAG TPA: ABC transporter permease [Candidatus Nanoarchaeia archaeon]|nr:ABC transporter permease [Candidatus Nanoarchaeia archaeon]